MTTPRTTPAHVESPDHDSSRARLARRVPRPLRRRLVIDAENTRLRGQVGVRNAWVH